MYLRKNFENLDIITEKRFITEHYQEQNHFP